ncbi:hypothetical protein HQ395_01540 [Aeromonas hydrophila]|uniref:hypothetical protein n=1 Tax=Aeromonas hydrophila TaxID=644 RepID=UPI001C05DC55|nr:hypothetical protein [Aeromonas hydrophila]QWL77273.1 hypothetical protein HQ395_01540 [Aeromonas hydrophila]
MVTVQEERGCGKQPPQKMTGRRLHGSGKHTHIQDRPIKVRMTIHKDMMRRGIATDRVIGSQGEIVNILLKIKNSFLPTKQILIGL